MAGRRQQESLISQTLFWIGDWATLMAFWIALTGSLRWTGLLVGAGASLIGSLISVATEAMTLVRFLPHWQYVWKSRSVLWQLPLGTISVLRTLAQHHGRATGRVHSISFEPGGESAEAQARRAVAEAFPSMAPASVVIGVDRDGGTVLFHLLGTDSPPPTLERLRDAQ